MTTGATTTHTLYIGSFYEETLTGAPNPPYIVYYILGSKMVGMRRANQPGVNTNGQFRVVGDQLGSTTLIIDTAPVPNVTQREYYKPFGEVAFTSGSSRTDKGFTGQRLDASSGLMYYGARYYDPVLSYFVSPDTIMPSSAGGSEENSKLTVDFHESGLLSSAAGENLQIVEDGFWFQLSDANRQNASEPWGPHNPQALNRYSYVFDNPLLYSDPSGHILYLSHEEAGYFVTALRQLAAGEEAFATAADTADEAQDPLIQEVEQWTGGGYLSEAAAGALKALIFIARVANDLLNVPFLEAYSKSMEQFANAIEAANGDYGVAIEYLQSVTGDSSNDYWVIMDRATGNLVLAHGGDVFKRTETGFGPASDYLDVAFEDFLPGVWRGQSNQFWTHNGVKMPIGPHFFGLNGSLEAPCEYYLSHGGRSCA